MISLIAPKEHGVASDFLKHSRIDPKKNKKNQEKIKLVQTPPLAVLLKVIVDCTHTALEPLIAPTLGRAFTVTVFVTVLIQPFPFVTA